jgi:hypothetical protein
VVRACFIEAVTVIYVTTKPRIRSVVRIHPSKLAPIDVMGRVKIEMRKVSHPGFAKAAQCYRTFGSHCIRILGYVPSKYATMLINLYIMSADGER